jgi:predicted branched-subunit amino acid permease
MQLIKRLFGAGTDPNAQKGIEDMLPAAVAMVAWGMVTGVAMVQSGLSPAQAVGMTFLVYAGSAQLTSLPLFAATAPFPIIWASALIVNLRFVIYAVAAKPFFRRLPLHQKLVYGFGMVDVLAAQLLRRFDPAQAPAASLLHDDGQARQTSAPLAYFKAASLMMWAVWQASSLVGIFFAQWIPAAWGLEFVATLALIALLMPMMLDRSAIVCVVVAGITAALCASLPLNLGLLMAVIAGVIAAMIVDSRFTPTPEKKDAASHGS